MSEKPILFNNEMVKAILDGRKTQTRRLIKAPALYEVSEPPDRIEKVTLPWADYQFTWHGKAIGGFDLKAPYRPGDVLWVRETWAKDVGRYMYKANYSDTEKFYMNGREIKMVWRPSIHMPRVAARIFLKVKSIRAGRIQDYFDASCAHAEGIIIDRPHSCQEAVDEFIKLWNSTIKPADLPLYGWDANPWVWTIGFERCINP